MPKTKQLPEVSNIPKTPLERDMENALPPPNTGPNVDTGLVAGLVTVDPDTAAGIAAANAREANGAKVTQHDNGIVEVTEGALPTFDDAPGQKGRSAMADPKAPAVDKVSAKVKAVDPTTIANEPEDIKADPKADVQ